MSGALSVAVIIPCRNTPTLERCVQALRHGEQPPDELIVVDDGSDPPLAPLPGARLLRQAPRGPAHARNLGAAQSRADVLLFVDADVVVGPQTVAQLVRVLAARPELSGVQTVYARTEGPFAARLSNAVQRFQMRRVAGRPLAGLSSYCVAVRRQAFEAAGGFDQQLNRATIEDDNLGLRLAARGAQLRVAQDVEVTHLAQPSLRAMLARMRRMAHDRALTLELWWAHRPPPGTATHHPAAQLVASALAGVALLVPPAAPLLWALSIGVQHELLAAVAREEGPAFAARVALALPLLSTAGAVGAASGLIAYARQRVSGPARRSPA